MQAMDIDEVLERTQWDLFWIPPGVRVVDRPELLYLTSSEPDEYLNAVLRTRGDDVERLVAEVSEAHRAVASRWTIPPTQPTTLGALEAAVTRHGYVRGHEHFGYSLGTSEHRPTPRARISVRPVKTLGDLRAAIDVSSRAFGRASGTSDERLAVELAACTAPGARVRRFVAFLDDEPVASAGMTLHPALRFAFLWAGGTTPEARGHGAYQALVDARVAAARAAGIERVGLYARLGSSAPIVERRGFTRHGPMTFWTRPRG